jgi:predicted CopG family antitoxin
MVTTIQLNETVKNQLDKLKKDRETYEEVIINLVRLGDKINRRQESLLIEGCREMASENLRITKQFEGIEDLSGWEW